jgi:cytochrome c-type biogenesis protein CcmF
MMIGGFLAASDKRYRVKQVASEDVVKAKLATV